MTGFWNGVKPWGPRNDELSRPRTVTFPLDSVRAAYPGAFDNVYRKTNIRDMEAELQHVESATRPFSPAQSCSSVTLSSDDDDDESNAPV